MPHSLAKISSLRTLFLEHTQLTGELPAEFSPKVAAVAAEVGSAFAEAQGPISESDTRGTVVQNDQIATQARVPLHLRVRPGTRLSAGPELTAALLMADGSLTAVSSAVSMINFHIGDFFSFDYLRMFRLVLFRRNSKNVAMICNFRAQNRCVFVCGVDVIHCCELEVSACSWAKAQSGEKNWLIR